MNINGNISPATEATTTHNWPKPPGQRNSTDTLPALPATTPAQPAAPGGLIGNNINTTA
ncbi:hypothetical protein [Trinickia terrae]|uniref:hypothetical protein n=1 Tax=Trinickia terrae TaxID=2571161 RepID=UPI00146C7F27|nr:hypothetical protein [Trinickia terrae]